jgi:DMSO/TMAO reductase YedYZ molybdopterin-dependent catalytic subunit
MNAEEKGDSLDQQKASGETRENRAVEKQPEQSAEVAKQWAGEKERRSVGESSQPTVAENAKEAREDEPRESPSEKPRTIETPVGLFAERRPEIIEVPSRKLRAWTRRDLLLFGAGVAATIVGGGFLLPSDTLARMGIRGNTDSPGKERFLNHAINLDDRIAEVLYSKDRLVPTYSKSDITPLKNNYNGATPDESYLPGWKLRLEGLASGLVASLGIQDLLTHFTQHEQITRLVCVEGWSAIAWWSGVRFHDLLRAYPPPAKTKWARVDSSVNLDAEGNPDPYYASIDLATAQHPQTLLATHYNGQPLEVEHGAPLRLLAPVKLGLKNVKAITGITYSAEEPRDYWAERGYSRYDGL